MVLSKCSSKGKVLSKNTLEVLELYENWPEDHDFVEGSISGTFRHGLKTTGDLFEDLELSENTSEELFDHLYLFSNEGWVYHPRNHIRPGQGTHQ